MKPVIALVLLVLAFDEPWLRAGGRHVVIYSDGSAAEVARVSRQLHAFTSILTELLGDTEIGHRDPCVTMFLIREQKSERLSGPRTTYLVARLSEDAGDVAPDVVRAYLRAHRPNAPPWLEMGLIETLGTFRDGKVGLQRREHLRRLLGSPVDLATILGAPEKATAWGLTQFLLFENTRDGVRRYLDGASFEEAFGTNVAEDFRRWISRRRITAFEKPLDAAPPVLPVPPAEVLVHAGNIALHENRERAMELFRQAVAADPKNVDARAMLGVVLKESGRKDEALDHLDVATRAGAKYPLAYLVQAEILLERAPPPPAVLEARGLLQTALNLDPSLSAAWAALAKTWVFDRDDFDKGVTAADRALALDVKSEDAALSLVLLHLKRNDLDRAVSTLEQRLRPIARQPSIDVAERAVIAWKLHRANTLAGAGELAAAKALVESVLATVSDENLRQRLALDMQQIELTAETVRLTEVYNRAVAAANDFRYDVALKLIEQVLREARDESLRADAEKMKQTLTRR